jgi:hypothetical protein
MPQTRPNKTKTIVNSDAYNLATDLAAMADSFNGFIQVANQTERDGLAALMGTVPVPTMVYRADLNAYESWNGASWDRITPNTLQAVNTSDGTWAYNCQLFTEYALNGSKMVTFQFIIARIGGGAFTVPTGSWTTILSALIPAGYRPTDSITVGGTYEFNGLGSALFKIDTSGNVFACGVTGSFSCGTPTKLSASFTWKTA